MLTPQDIETKQFSKAVFGGYDMAAVDEFLEEVTTDYTALYKENAVLKGKLKVLVEKVEEYRSTEDAMRMALLTAQNMSDDMMAEAKQKSADIVTEAERQASEAKLNYQRDYEQEVNRINALKAETAKFVEQSRSIMEQHAQFLSTIDRYTGSYVPDIHYEEPVFSPEPEVAQKAAEVTSVPEEDDATRRLPDISEAETPQEPMGDETRRLDFGWSQEDEELTPRPKFKFDDLKFGSNYNEGK